MEWEKYVEKVNNSRLIMEFGQMVQYHTKTKLTYNDVKHLWDSIEKQVDKIQEARDQKQLQTNVNNNLKKV